MRERGKGKERREGKGVWPAHVSDASAAYWTVLICNYAIATFSF